MGKMQTSIWCYFINQYSLHLLRFYAFTLIEYEWTELHLLFRLFRCTFHLLLNYWFDVCIWWNSPLYHNTWCYRKIAQQHTEYLNLLFTIHFKMTIDYVQKGNLANVVHVRCDVIAMRSTVLTPWINSTIEFSVRQIVLTFDAHIDYATQ